MSQSESPGKPAKRRRLTPIVTSSSLEEDLLAEESSKKMDVVEGGGGGGSSSVFASPLASGPSTSTSSPNSTATVVGVDVALKEARDVDSLKRMLGEIYAETSPCDEEDLTWLVVFVVAVFSWPIFQPSFILFCLFFLCILQSSVSGNLQDALPRSLWTYLLVSDELPSAFLDQSAYIPHSSGT